MNLKDRLQKLIEQKRQVSNEEMSLINDEINQYKKEIIDDNTVVIIESHRKHAEIYPSVIKYFLDLGYNVHLLNLLEHEKENSLSRCNFSDKQFKIFSFVKMPETEEFFDILLKYKQVFVCTLFTHDGYNFVNKLEQFYIKKYSKTNVYCIDHDLISLQKNIETIEQRFLNNDKVFVLRNNIKYKSKNLQFLSPTYFGDVKILPKNTDIVHFVSIGGGLQNNLRNFKLLLETIDKLIDNNILNFKVIFVGISQSQLNSFINPKNSKHLSFLGYCNYEKMYQTLENGDFILYNIDKSCNEYSKYFNLGITGSYSLTLGFSKPAIVDAELAKNYNIQNGCITYEYGNLFYAMQKAIDLSVDKYEKLQTSLTKFNSMLKQNSLHNLSEKLDNSDKIK